MERRGFYRPGRIRPPGKGALCKENNRINRWLPGHAPSAQRRNFAWILHGFDKGMVDSPAAGLIK
jgi:hypothetical protein